MKVILLFLSIGLLSPSSVLAQDSLPTFTRTYTAHDQNYSYTVVGGDPAKGGTTTLPTVLAPITLTIEAPMDASGAKAVLDAGPEVDRVLRSPIFSNYRFSSGTTQYADAIMRADFSKGIAKDWHTLLQKPKVIPLKIDVPIGKGYVLTSKKTGRVLAMVDVLFMQQQIFQQLPKEDTGAGTLVIAMTKNVTYYTDEDATECCSWGTHGIDTSQGSRQPFVLGSYLDSHTVDEDSDVQPLTQQLAQFFRDPLHEPAFHLHHGVVPPGNQFPPWMKAPPFSAVELPADNRSCGGTGLATDYFLNDPTDSNWKNRTPASKPFNAKVNGMSYHLQNVALLSWYAGTPSKAYSFPDAKALIAIPAMTCPIRVREGTFGAVRNAPATITPPVAMTRGPNGHHLIGYWAGLGRLTEVSPQWDVIIVAFATPPHGAPEGTMQYKVQGNLTPEEFKADIMAKQSQGKKVMISLGGGGQHFALLTEEGKQNFIRTVEEICTQYGFNGIDIDFETSSLELDPGDTDFKHPTTPSTVNLIAAMREIHDHFGKDFMLSLVPEGTQIPAAYPGYGGQFGSYLPIVEGIRDILAFVDTQDYNCPPIEGLDGEYYMPGSVDYHAAATELVLHGFDVGRDPKHHFDPLPPEKVAIGFLNSDTTPLIVQDAMRYLITGKSSTKASYKLQQSSGYPAFDGAMFWTIDDDRRENYRYSNTVGPLLHSYQ
ncbi:MAG: glycosyl hydrolase family 18 protein [Acidobacteriaceae bacterium]